MSRVSAIPDAKCVVVTTPQEISLADVRKALDFLKVVKADVLGLVENMSYVSCPDCGRKIYLFGEGKSEEAARRHSLPLLAQMPIDPALAALTDDGRIEDFSGSWLDPVADALEKAEKRAD